MTIQELYAKIGGNYEQAVKVMRMDKLIDKFVRMLPASGAYEKLAAAGQSMDPVQLFESAHGLKGVCANLGLTAIASAAEEITEEFRPGAVRKMTDGEVKEKIARIDQLYHRAVEGIQEYTLSV